MKYNYVVTLKSRQSVFVDAVGFLLSIISVAAFIREMVMTSSAQIAYLLGSIFIVGFLAWNVYQSAVRHRKVFYARALLIAALVWMKMPYFQWLTFALIILAFLEYQAKYSIEVGFSDNQVVINSLWKRRHRWSDFSNILLKDGILTMDFRNNHILQREVEDDVEDDADEEEFNNYCRACLARTQPV